MSKQSIGVKGVIRFCPQGVLPRINGKHNNGEFNHFFMDKVETHVPPARIEILPAMQDGSDEDILHKLDGRPEMKLAYLFSLTGQQLDGREGFLATGKCGNIAHIRDKSRIMKWVHVVWQGDHWVCNAYKSKSEEVVKIIGSGINVIACVTSVAGLKC